MKRVKRFICLGLVLTAIALGVSGPAQNGGDVKVVFERAIPNIEGKRMVAVVVNYPPGGRSPAHHHAPSAFIYAHVLSGAIRSQVDDEPAKVYHVGEGFYEVAGSHHRISENASDRDPASLLAVFVVDSKDTPLTIPDKKLGSRNGLMGQDRQTVSRTLRSCICSTDLAAESKQASMTNAAMIATGIEITWRIFSPRFMSSQQTCGPGRARATALLRMRKTRNSPAAS